MVSNPRINIKDSKAVVISGSDYAHSHRSYFLRRVVKNIVEDAKNYYVKILGVCSGIQTLGIAFGHKVVYMENPEVGWYNMELTKVGRRDALFKGFPDEFEGFSTHIKKLSLNGKADCILVFLGILV